MRGTKYLSELVNPEMFQTDKLNVIKAPTGSGKTYFALKTIAGSLPDATHKSVYLIDTVNGQQQILKNYGAQAIYGDWEEEVDEKWISFEDNRQIVVITYAKFGVILEKILIFISVLIISSAMSCQAFSNLNTIRRSPTFIPTPMTELKKPFETDAQR